MIEQSLIKTILVKPHRQYVWEYTINQNEEFRVSDTVLKSYLYSLIPSKAAQIKSLIQQHSTFVIFLKEGKILELYPNFERSTKPFMDDILLLQDNINKPKRQSFSDKIKYFSKNWLTK